MGTKMSFAAVGQPAVRDADADDDVRADERRMIVMERPGEQAAAPAGHAVSPPS